MLLKIGAAITNWGKIYYKLGQLLQIGVVITNWGLTVYSKYQLVWKVSAMIYIFCKCAYMISKIFTFASQF